MPLELAPEVETTVRQYAEREGVSINDLLARAFPPISPVSNLLRQWQQEYGLPARPEGKTHTSAQELFSQWDAEDAQLTPEEAKAEAHLWENFQQEHQRVAI